MRVCWTRLALLLSILLVNVVSQSGVIRIPDPEGIVSENDKYYFLAAERTGGTDGIVEVNVSVKPESTATFGKDFQFAGPTFLRWSHGEAGVKAIVVHIFDDDVWDYTETVMFSFDVYPPSARGANVTESILYIEDDGDAGELVFTPTYKALWEEVHYPRPEDESCIFRVERQGGSSGRVELQIVANASACGPQVQPYQLAVYGQDYYVEPLKRSIVWEDGESGNKCAVKEVSWFEDPLEDQVGVYFFNDAEVEPSQFVCFRPYFVGNTTAKLSADVLTVASIDLGKDGGGNHTCVKGWTCKLNVTITMAVHNDTVFFQAGDHCDPPKIAEEFNVSDVGDDNETILIVDVGDRLDDKQPGQLSLCLLSNWTDPSRPFLMASMTLKGPSTANTAHCIKGAPSCSVRKLEGFGFVPGRDHLQIMVKCGSAETTPIGFEIGGRAVLDSNMSFRFRDMKEMSTEEPGIYKMCWCRASPTQDCSNLTHFKANAGTFIFHGPYMLGNKSLPLGGALKYKDVAGIAMTANDSARLQKHCGDDDGDGHWVQANVSSNMRTYDFGVLSVGRIPALKYEVCWCQKDIGSGVACDQMSQFGAWFGYVDVYCPGRTVDLNEDGSCELCAMPWDVASADHDSCVLDVGRLFCVLTCIALTTIGFMAFFTQIEVVGVLTGNLKKVRIHGRRLYVEDIGLEGTSTVLTVAGAHYLHTCCDIPLTLHDTGHSLLDSGCGNRKGFRARADGGNRLILLDDQSQPLQTRADSSMGYALLSIPRSLVHTRFHMMPCFLLLAISWGTSAALLLYLETDFIQFIVLTVPSMIAGASLTCVQKCKKRHGTLANRLRLYHKKLHQNNPHPVACRRGPDRAVAVDVLFDLLSFFGAFIQDRTMYYLHPNILMPLTAPHKLSFAEVVGPKKVDWFVSHWWGTEFRTYCEALREHASATSKSDVVDAWRNTSYWICTFSNNQYQVPEELGKTHQESSFYLALHSGMCKGTCMILDEHAMPLTRSWCLFELLQTIQLEKQSGFQGLLFCTRNGVLNYGASTVEMSMKIGKHLANLSLKDAEASEPADKEMINSLVIEQMHSFANIDAVLRDHIGKALETCRDCVDSDFGKLFKELNRGIDGKGDAVTL